MNPAEFGNLANRITLLNRRSVSEGSEIVKLDGQESSLSPTCGIGSC